MEDLYSIMNWGSPVGIALFFFFSCAGVGILFWGIGQINKSKSKK